jgi:hypothetical protein
MPFPAPVTSATLYLIFLDVDKRSDFINFLNSFFHASQSWPPVVVKALSSGNSAASSLFASASRSSTPQPIESSGISFYIRRNDSKEENLA